MRRRATQDARLRAVRMDDVRTELAEHALKLLIRRPIVEGIDRAPQRRNDFDRHAAIARPLEQTSLWSQCRASNEQHVIPMQANQILAVEERVLLRATEDQSSDDVSDAHGL